MTCLRCEEFDGVVENVLEQYNECKKAVTSSSDRCIDHLTNRLVGVGTLDELKLFGGNFGRLTRRLIDSVSSCTICQRDFDKSKDAVVLRVEVPHYLSVTFDLTNEEDILLNCTFSALHADNCNTLRPLLKWCP